jgi:hypothetical protein
LRFTIYFFFASLRLCGSALLLLACAVVLSGCGKQSHWACDQIHSDKEAFCSNKLTYRSGNPARGIDLEFLKTTEHLATYLNIHSLPIAARKKDPNTTPLTIEIEGETFHYLVRRLTGGQRFLLPSEASQQIIDALQDHKEVQITLASYKTSFKPEDFPLKFEKLLRPSTLQNPFRLPF